MKKIKFITITIAIMLIFCSCEPAEEVGKTAIDCRYTEAYVGVETEYKYVYAPLKGEFVYTPITYSVFHPEKYEILYLVSYQDGSTKEKWQEVDENTYMSFKGGAE